jgi:hypothetical protein
MTVYMRFYFSLINFKEGHLGELKLAQHAFEEGQRIIWDGARISEIESKSRHRKYKELAHTACLKNSFKLL